MPTIEVAVVVRRPKREVYSVIKRMEDFPFFMKDIKNIRVMKRSGDTSIALWEAEIEGAPVMWKQEDCFDDAECKVRFNMLEGSYKKYQGCWVVEEHARGCRVSLAVSFDWGIPVLEKYVGTALEKKAKRGLLGMIVGIKRKAERSNV